jgi:hypothetical protein
MDLRKGTSQFEGDAKIVDSIASRFDENAQEYAALKRAAIALWYVYVSAERHADFQKYVENFEGDLTEEQRRRLHEMGINPDVEAG